MEFDYHESGNLIRCNRKNIKFSGTLLDTGYVVVGFNKNSYLLHKLIYCYHTGDWPEFIDHIDQDKSNNKIENLRPATISHNGANRSIMTTNTSGYKGVSFHKAGKKWRASIKARHIGSFNTKEEAALAYNEKALEEYGEYASLNIIESM